MTTVRCDVWMASTWTNADQLTGLEEDLQGALALPHLRYVLISIGIRAGEPSVPLPPSLSDRRVKYWFRLMESSDDELSLYDHFRRLWDETKSMTEYTSPDHEIVLYDANHLSAVKSTTYPWRTVKVYFEKNSLGGHAYAYRGWNLSDLHETSSSNCHNDAMAIYGDWHRSHVEPRYTDLPSTPANSPRDNDWFWS